MSRVPSSPARILTITAALAVTAVLAGCGPMSSSLGTGSPGGSGTADTQQRAASGLLKIHDPKKVTYFRDLSPSSCKFRNGDQLPDPSCTPGAIDPAVTQANIHSTICRTGGYTTKVRPPESETEHAKFKISYPAYDLRHSAKSELDHLVSLELGGSNDIANLWPEVGKQPNPKDKVENDLHDAVCSGQVSLSAAQQAIAADWTTAESRLGVG